MAKTMLRILQTWVKTMPKTVKTTLIGMIKTIREMVRSRTGIRKMARITKTLFKRRRKMKWNLEIVARTLSSQFMNNEINQYFVHDEVLIARKMVKLEPEKRRIKHECNI